MWRSGKGALAVTAAAVGIAITLTACSSTGGKKATESSKDSGGSVVTGGRKLTIAMVTHEAAGDTFWDKIRNGAQASAKEHGITLKYSNNDQPAQQATLIQAAVDSKVDGIATTLATPDALAGAVKSAEAAKIPIVAFNSGINDYQRLGIKMYFGSDESLAGETLGQKIAAAGGKKVLCVIHAQGSVALEARCAGVKKGIPNTENVQVNGTDITSVTSTLQAKLQQDKSIDWVVTLGAPIALAAMAAKKGANSHAKIATFDLNAEAAKAIKSGEIVMSVDQQPYVQGYEAVDSLWRELTNGNDLGGGKPVLTGPSFVDSSNIAQILPYAEKNTR